MISSGDGLGHACHCVEGSRRRESGETPAFIRVHSYSLVVERNYPWFRARSFSGFSVKSFLNFFSFAKTVAQCISIRLPARLFIRLFSDGPKFVETRAMVCPGRCSIHVV